MPKIEIACKTEQMIDWRILKPLQGELKSLSKENYEKLRGEIVDTGFAFPLFVWQGPDGSEDVRIVGGHQRLRCIRQMVEREGYECGFLPVVFIEAKNKKEAMRRVVQDVSQYGHVTGDGLYEFMHDAEIDIQTLIKTQDIPNLDLERFAEGYFSLPTKDDATDLATDNEDKDTVECPECGHHFKKA